MPPNNKQMLFPFVSELENDNRSPGNNEPSSADNVIVPNINNANHALRMFEKNIDSTPPSVLVRYRPQLEKVGAMGLKDGSASKAKLEFQKLVKYTNHLNDKLLETEKAFAEWINTFESDDVADFAAEVEKFMKLHYQFNTAIAANLEIVSNSFTTVINSETERNSQMNKYFKAKKEREDARKKNTEPITLSKYKDKIIMAYSSCVTSQMLYESNVQKLVRPALFGYCNAIRTNSEKMSKLSLETSLDLKRYAAQLLNKSPYTDYHQNLSDLNVGIANESNERESSATLYVQKPNHANDSNEELSNGIKNLKLGTENYGNSEGSSEFESEPEEEHHIGIFSKNPYDYSSDQIKKLDRFKSPLFKQSTVLNGDTDYHNNLLKATFHQREIPNETNNFDSTENYPTFVNEKTQRDTRSKYVGALINDHSVTDLWKSN